MEVTVLRSGVHATVQDLGRPAHRRSGVPLGGAMDGFALRVANLLVGNAEHEAGIEVTLGGAEFSFDAPAVVAVGGAEYDEVPSWKPLSIAKGGTLRLGACRRGFRGYLAVRGGIAVPPVLGSRSTYVRGGFGGFEGRPLREGDRLPIGGPAGGFGAPAPAISAFWGLLPSYSKEPNVRAVPGAQAELFAPEWAGAAFEVTAHSDRMGLRLKGPMLAAKPGPDLPSRGVVPGTIQVPPDGQPIVLGADAQTIGGYPQLAHAITVDLPLLAQLRPGDRVRFRTVTLAEAQWLALKREQDLALLRAGAVARWNDVGT